MKKQRPVNLDLQTIQFPVTAIASIVHRASGVVTFITIGVLLWLLGLSLSSPEGFGQVSVIMSSFVMKLIFWGVLTALVVHICGGIRHLLMDFGYLEESLAIGAVSAKISMGLALVLSILAGVFIW